MSVVLQGLEALDLRLSVAVDAVKVLFGPDSARDLFRGLHIAPADADRTLGCRPVAPLLGPLGFQTCLVSSDALAGTRFDHLRQAFGLSAFDVDALLVVLAPEIDTRYERLYAFIQDDVAKKRPTVDLLLNLLSSSIEEKLDGMRRFAADAPLVRHGLLRWGNGAGPMEGSRLSAALAIDEAVVAHLLGHSTLDGRIAPHCRVEPAQGVEFSMATRRLPLQDLEHGGAYYVRGSDPHEVLASVRESVGGRDVLVLDVERALSAAVDWELLLSVALRSARLGAHVVFMHGLERLWEPDNHGRLRQLLHRLLDHSGLVCLAGAAPWPPVSGGGAPVLPLDVDEPDPAARQYAWREELARLGIEVPALTLAEVGATFELTRAQVADAARYAAHRAQRRGDCLPERDDLFLGARLQTRSALLELAERLEVQADWGDLVLPPETVSQLREIAVRVARRGTVLRQWGFGRKPTYGKGTAVVFAGPSGTGKTFAAAVLANEVGLDLHRIDLSRVVSKYIGETEKNLARIFAAAERANCILLFDEAEALFGKRSDVRDAHDRYANQELSYLLQRIEHFDGMAILTTNMPGSMDEAFRRRLAATVYFPLPDLAARRRLWEQAWPPAAPLAGDVDARSLASHFKISGGIIVQAALGAAYLAAESGPPISMKHVLHALRREFDALGIPMPTLSPIVPEQATQ